MKRICLCLIASLIILTFISGVDAVNATTTYKYDKYGNLSATSSSGTTNYKFDENGNLIRIIKSDNLVMNSGFEQKSLGWNTGPSFFIQEAETKEGDNSLM